jgi:hypothetical protein
VNVRDVSKLWLIIAACAACAIAFVACSEGITNPVTPGSGLFRNDGVVKTDTLFADSSAVFVQRIRPGIRASAVLNRNLVGRDGDDTAYTLLRFLPDTQSTIHVLSAKVVLRVRSWRGLSRTSTFEFTAHRINLDWDPLIVTWDTVARSGFCETTPIGTFISTSMDSSISFNLDTSHVRRWFRADSNYGIVLKPTPATTRLILGFQAFTHPDSSKRPRLEIRYRKGTDTTVFLDTTSVGFDSYVANSNPLPMTPDRVFMQGSVAHYGVLRFNTARLQKGAIINTAEMLLERDPALSELTQDDSIANQPSVHTKTDTGKTAYEFTSSTGSLKSGTNVYSFDVRRQVQIWMSSQKNFGLLLRQPDVNENNMLDLFVFYNQNAANPALRPRIIVKYTLLQTQKPSVPDTSKVIRSKEEL